MSQLPDIHLCVQQPVGYVHSLGFLDQARYFRYQFRRLGARVTIAKNRLRYGAVNFVFGAHLGFDRGQLERYACIFVNLEQMGDGGAQLPGQYLKLLSSAAVVDYNVDNVTAYAARADEVPIVPILYAPYLKPEQATPIEDRPIDLLFIGSMNDRRRAWIERIEALGLTVALFDGPLYGAERDAFIVQSKAVLNAHFYESSRFEQARVAHCLSLGTMVISERTTRTRPHAAFEDCVLWLEGEQLEQFFAEDFKTPAFYDLARQALRRFESADPIESYAELLAFACGFEQGHRTNKPQAAWKPRSVNLGSGKDYRPGWLNLDLLERADPDLVLDLGRTIQWPLDLQSPTAGPIRLEESQLDVIYANNVLEHVPDLTRLMSNGLTLLKPGGQFVIEVPYEHAATAWQDPTHVRAMNENSWIYYTDWFWYLGWLDHRFEVQEFGYLDATLNTCGRERAAFMRVTLRKIDTTLRERTTARTLQPDLRLPDDEVDASMVYRLPVVAESVTQDSEAAPVF